MFSLGDGYWSYIFYSLPWKLYNSALCDKTEANKRQKPTHTLQLVSQISLKQEYELSRKYKRQTRLHYKI